MNKCPQCGSYMTPQIQQVCGGWRLVWECSCGYSTEDSGIYYDHKTDNGEELEGRK